MDGSVKGLVEGKELGEEAQTRVNESELMDFQWESRELGWDEIVHCFLSSICW